jgi:CCR4-NOT transcription complex subunit 6
MHRSHHSPYAPFFEACGEYQNLRIRVASWNILAEHCLKFHPYVSYQDGERKHRLRDVLEALVDKKVDFICLQEVDRETVGSGVFRLLLEGNYGCFSATQSGLTPSIFYDENRWKLVGELVVEMDDLATLGCNRGCPTSLGLNFEKGKHGLIARLKHAKTGQQVVVVNTHLSWQEDLEFVKVCQVHYLMLKLKAYTQNGDAEIIFCGDLNSLPGSDVHKYLRGEDVSSFKDFWELLEYEYGDVHGTDDDESLAVWDWLSGCFFPACPFVFTSVYGDGSKECHPFTNVTPTFEGCIDYIFIRSFSRLQLKGRFELPASKEELKKKYHSEVLPSRSWPSDHLLLGAEFFLLVPYKR